MQYGPQSALIAESFPTRLRYSGAGLGYQLASLTAGGPAPLIAIALLHNYDVWSIPAYMVGMCAVGCVATLVLPDRTRERISDDAAYAPRRAAVPRPSSSARYPVAGVCPARHRTPLTMACARRPLPLWRDNVAWGLLVSLVGCVAGRHPRAVFRGDVRSSGRSRSLVGG